jgi:hypothetical protein
MTVGNLLPPSQRVERPLERFAGSLPNRAAVYDDLAAAELFEDPATAPDRRQPPRGRGPRPGKLISLTKLVETKTDWLDLGTQFGSEAVGVPFTHLVLLGSFTEPLERALRQQIEEKLTLTLNTYVDDLLGVRVLCRNCEELAPDTLLLYFGRGVFVPTPGEQPQGQITITTAQGHGPEQSEPPVLSPDLGPIPAGFYRGQGGLAFGSSQRRVAATCTLLPIDERAYFHLGPDPYNPTALDLLRPEDDSDYAYFVRAIPPGDGEAAFEIDCHHRATDERHKLTLRCTRDARVSRLHRQPPNDRAYVEIVGFVAPQNGGAGVSPRWWIDLDRDNRLIGLAGIGRATSVLCERGKLTHYDWHDLRFKPKAAVAHRLERIRADEADLTVLRARDNTAFGYLALPETAVPVTFQSEWWTQAHCYTLDWLDFSGGVGATTVVGLAADASRHWQDQYMPGADPARRKAHPQGWRLRRPGTSEFRTERSYDPAPGTELIVGPLVLRVPVD